MRIMFHLTDGQIIEVDDPDEVSLHYGNGGQATLPGPRPKDREELEARLAAWVTSPTTSAVVGLSVATVLPSRSVAHITIVDVDV